MIRYILAVCVCLTASTATTAAGDAPRVVTLFPAHEATDVDPGITELRIVFDRDMSTQGWSVCGAGETFPKTHRTLWADPRTLVMRVSLVPDHDYRMSLNCPASDQHFRSAADGTPLPMVPWSFSTAAKAHKLTKAEQKKLNSRCLKELMKLLRTRYSYYKLRDVDWKTLEKKHRKKIIAAGSTRTWVKRVAKMLSAAEDMHLWINYRGVTTATCKRKVTHNVNIDGVKAVLPQCSWRNNCVMTARTDDGIGYILVSTLLREEEAQIAEVQNVLGEYRDCKALILDLRPNGGGAEPLAVPIAAWFIEGKKVYAKNVNRDPDAPGGFGPVNERTIQGNDESRRFKGPVAVLMGPGNMSSCEAFLLMLKQGENVTLIGERSFGASGNPQSYMLANGVEVFIPLWKAMRPDGACFEGKGIEPDIKVSAKPSQFKRGDPVLERALKYLRGKTE